VSGDARADFENAGRWWMRWIRPVKGMLTGPVTMLAGSFVRTDQPVADRPAYPDWAARAFRLVAAARQLRGALAR